MKRRFWLLSLVLAVGVSVSRASEYKAVAAGPFIVITKLGYSENNVVSIRKSAVISLELRGKKIFLVTSAVEVVTDSLNGKERKIDRSVNYSFEGDTDVDTKRLFDFIMEELGRGDDPR